MKNLKLVSPWVNFYKEVEALFSEDPAVKLELDDEEMTLKLFVDGALKAEALTELLPTEKTFGDVTLKIEVIPANIIKEDKLALFKAAFEGNPVFSYACGGEGVFKDAFKYVVFKNKVVQYFNDDLRDVNGNRSTLYQELAKDVFGEEGGVSFCTDTDPFCSVTYCV